jgi:hypothetical protein
MIAGGIVLSGRPMIEQPAEVDEMLLRRRPFAPVPHGIVTTSRPRVSPFTIRAPASNT